MCATAVLAAREERLVQALLFKGTTPRGPHISVAMRLQSFSPAQSAVEGSRPVREQPVCSPPPRWRRVSCHQGSTTARAPSCRAEPALHVLLPHPPAASRPMSVHPPDGVSSRLLHDQMLGSRWPSNRASDFRAEEGARGWQRRRGRLAPHRSAVR
eukprot:scaffold173176_cov31-Tisochrysis_lutea.AAC.3